MKVKPCPLAQKHHKESSRQFAHVFHRKNTICVTPEFYELPQGYQLGILLHELGHLALKGKNHSEEDADSIAFLMSGALIERRTYRGMKGLEYINRYYKAPALRFLREKLA